MATIEEKIADKKRRLELYRQQEERMLTGQAQSYGVGTRNVSKYPTELTTIQNAIKTLEKEIDALENAQNGKSANRTYTFVPADV